MTMYVSNNDWRLSDAYVNNTGEIPPPRMLMCGEIDLPDGTTFIYPAESFQVHQTPALDVHPQEDGLTFTGVMEAFVEDPQSDAKGRAHLRRVPVGAVAMIMLGLVFIAFGLVLREPTSWFIYHLIHK